MSDTPATERPDWERLQRSALIAGGVGCLLFLVGYLIDSTRFFRSYLIAIQLLLALGLGSMAILMVHHLTGGRWGASIRRILEASIRVFPWVVLAFVPLLLFGMHDVYPWMNWSEEELAASHMLHQKSHYLNQSFFLIRQAIYFGVWLGFCFFLDRGAKKQDENDTPELRRRLRGLSAAGLPIYGVLITFASIDWVMSLNPKWYSTMFGVLFGVSQILTAHAFAIVVLVLLIRKPPLDNIIKRGHLRDLGGMLLAFVMLWAYMAFSQFLLIWSANLKEEIPYFIHRTGGTFGMILSFIIIIGHFALPFLLLLMRDVKGNVKWLGMVAGWILLMRVVELGWEIIPAYLDPENFPGATEGVGPHWIDLVAVVGLGGLWLFGFMRSLASRPLEPIERAVLEEEVHGD